MYKRIQFLLEVKLGFFGKKNKGDGRLVGLCQMATGSSLVCVRRGKEGRPVLLSAVWEPVSSESGQVDAIRTLARQQPFQEAGAVSVLTPNVYQLMQLELADLPIEERREAARWQIRELLDFPIAEAVVDIFSVSPFGSDKKPLTYVVAARETMLRERVESLQQADLKSAAIDIPEFALRNLAELFQQDERGTAILYLQEQGGMLTVVRDGIQYLTRYLGVGMDDLIPHADGSYEMLIEQLDAIVLEIQRTFDYCESTFHLPMVSRLLIAQTQREIPAVTTYLNDYLSTSVEPFSLADVMDLPEVAEQLDLNRHLLAIGGALRQEQG